MRYPRRKPDEWDTRPNEMCGSSYGIIYTRDLLALSLPYVLDLAWRPGVRLYVCEEPGNIRPSSVVVEYIIIATAMMDTRVGLLRCLYLQHNINSYPLMNGKL